MIGIGWDAGLLAAGWLLLTATLFRRWLAAHAARVMPLRWLRWLLRNKPVPRDGMPLLDEDLTRFADVMRAWADPAAETEKETTR